VSGGLVLASASCTTPGAAAAGGGTPTGQGQTTSSNSAVGGTSTTAAKAKSSTAAAAAPAALSEKTNGDLARTGANGSLMPIAIIAVVLVLGGAGLMVFLRKKAAGLKAKE
jgi:LPXTG-motif cell wall-anchored protein